MGAERPAAAVRCLLDSLDDGHIAFKWRLDDNDLDVLCTLDDEGRMSTIVLERRGDPDSTGKSGRYPFGFEATGYAIFNGVTIPSAGRAGWFIGTNRWHDGEFFRYEIRDYSERGRLPATDRRAVVDVCR